MIRKWIRFGEFFESCKRKKRNNEFYFSREHEWTKHGTCALGLDNIRGSKIPPKISRLSNI